jgi:hypothetical protein
VGGRAGHAEADRQKPAPRVELLAHHIDQAFEFGRRQRETFARGRGKDHPVDRAVCVTRHQPPQRRLVELSVTERRHQRQPEAVQVISQIIHWLISSFSEAPGDGGNKKPRTLTAGFRVWLVLIAIARAEPDSPGGELFSTTWLRTKS